jgi:predicted amidophosphoribosyltransferase
MFDFKPKILRERHYLKRRGIKDYYYLCYYKKKSCPYDKFSLLLFDFKEGRPIVHNWANWSSKAIATLELSKDTLVIRALSSRETVISDNGVRPLDIIGKKLQEDLGYTYKPSIIFKAFPTRQLKQCRTEDDRTAALKEAYRLSPNCPNLNGKTVLVLDDVKTYGTTLNAIEQAILSAYPQAEIIGFTLAQTNCGGQNDDLNILCDAMKATIAAKK